MQADADASNFGRGATIGLTERVPRQWRFATGPVWETYDSPAVVGDTVFVGDAMDTLVARPHLDGQYCSHIDLPLDEVVLRSRAPEIVV